MSVRTRQVPRQTDFVARLTADVVAHARHVAAEHARLWAVLAELQGANARARLRALAEPYVEAEEEEGREA